jgi:8-oxo-dGTP pyrophosphatase MutT (NUDIX family)
MGQEIDREAVGIVIVAKDTNNFLLLHRSSEPIVWSVLSGGMEEGESEVETIKREIKEEININADYIDDIEKLGSETFKKTLFHIYIGYSDHEFDIPNLKLDENDDYGWFNENNLPSPIHKRWPKTFQLLKPRLTLRESMRTNLQNLLYGREGRMGNRD